MPLYNVFQRFLRPLGRYKRFITDDLQPTCIDKEIAVVGVNTARSLVFKGGRINEEQVAGIREKMCQLGEHVTKIVVTHHPFDVPGSGKNQIVGRARMALERLAGCGADVFLAGHLHASHVGHTREEPNAFNLLRVEPRHIEVDQYVLQGGDFVLRSTEAFDHGRDGWHGSA